MHEGHKWNGSRCVKVRHNLLTDNDKDTSAEMTWHNMHVSVEMTPNVYSLLCFSVYLNSYKINRFR